VGKDSFLKMLTESLETVDDSLKDILTKGHKLEPD
jgi:hypothetical protein